MSSQGVIYAWGDGFCYPLGWLDPPAPRNVEFVFGEILGQGSLDFQYLSSSKQASELQKTTPAHYACADSWIEEYPKSEIEAEFLDRRFYTGAAWPDGTLIGDRTIVATQILKIKSMYGSSAFRLDTGVTHSGMEFFENTVTDFAILFNLTKIEGDDIVYAWLENVKVDIYASTPEIDLLGLEYAGTSNGGRSTVTQGFYVVGDTVVDVLATIATTYFLEKGLIVGIGMKTLWTAIKVLGDNHEEPHFGEEISTVDHRRIWYNDMCDIWQGVEAGTSNSHTSWMKMKASTKWHCGALKMVFSGYLVSGWNIPCYPNKVYIGFQTTLCIPIFVKQY